MLHAFLFLLLHALLFLLLHALAECEPSRTRLNSTELRRTLPTLLRGMSPVEPVKLN
jgi:hypothetical protein